MQNKTVNELLYIAFDFERMDLARIAEREIAKKGEDARPLLEEIMISENYGRYEKRIALELIGRIGSEKSVSNLRKALTLGIERDLVVLALGEIKYTNEDTKRIILRDIEKYLDSLKGDVMFRRNASFSLAKIGGEKALEIIRSLLKDRDFVVSENAKMALGIEGREKSRRIDPGNFAQNRTEIKAR